MSSKIDQVINFKIELNNKSIKEQDKLYDILIEISDKINKRFPDSVVTIGSELVPATGICLQDRQKY